VVVGELLLSEGGDTTALDSNGKTPDLDKLLMAAVESGSRCTYVNACRVILDKGADPNYEGDNGAQPLMMAIEKQNVELCCLLLNRGASIPISHDEEPFHIGTDWKMTDLTRLLLSFGVDIRCARIGEQTVWERSKQSGTRDMACLLNAADSYPEEIVSQGEAAFQIYLKSCNEGSAVTVFLRIDVVGRDGVGKTSLVKSLTLQNFDQFELSTRGIAVYPNCQIIVKEACNWTTPLTRSDYRDIYDRNVIAIVADSFDKPKVRNEFFSSRVERRPMHLRIDPGNISAVKYPEYSPPNDMSMQQIDSGAVEAITSSDNSEEVQESMLQSISVATPKTAQQRSDAWSRLSGSLKIENQDKCEKFIPSAEKLSDEEVGHRQPSIPESTKNRIVQMLRNPESREKVKNEIVVTILDYAGHNVFYVTHQLCLSKEAFYYIVWDVSLPLDAITGSVFIFREGETVHNIILPSDETNYDRIEEWISAIHIMEPSNSRRTILFEKVGIRSPAVFLVGTHADELKSEPDMLERQEKFLRDRLEGTVLAEHIVWASKDKMCFYVDNTLSNQQNGTVDKQVILLRQKTEEVARQMAQHHQVPITWLKFQQEVQELKESKKEKKAASVGELRQIAMESAGIGEEELFVLLRYLSNRSVLLYHPMAFNSNMDEEVVLDVEWLVTQLEKIITVQTAVPAILTSAVERCSEKGIMTVDLIKHLLQENGSARYQCLIMFFMGQFDLLCEYAALEDLKQADDQRDYVNLNPSTDHCQPKEEPHMQCKQTEDYHRAYFIPSLLQRPTVVQSLSVPVAVKRAPYLLLSSGRLRMPRPLFYRLLTRLCKRFRRLPRLYQNAGYFRVHYNHELEVVLNRFSLQLTVLTKHQTPLIPDVCCAVRNFVVSEVNEAKQLAMSGLELEMGFLHKVSCGSSKDVPEEFVSLEGYPTKRKRVYIKSIDMEINLPPDLKVWFPCTDELSVIGDPDGDQNSRLFPSPEVTQSTDVSVLLCGYQPHACLMEVARSLDKYDPMKDDWRRLWSHLTRRDGDVNLVKEQSESPTIYTLRMWCRMAPLKSATVGRLVAALSAIYRNDVASKLSGYIESACKNEETFSNTVAPQCCHDLTLVLPAVLECAAHRWYVIATEMGYSEGQITDMVSGIPEAADKLTKIVNCKKMSENSGIVADSLLKACGSIPNPVLAAVQEKMKCHQLTLK
jgi:GTPase SAR1 family protein